MDRRACGMHRPYHYSLGNSYDHTTERISPTASPGPMPITVSRELIFETEKDLPTDTFPNYSDNKISTDSVFTDSRVFEIPNGTAVVTLPKLLIVYLWLFVLLMRDNMSSLAIAQQ